MVNTTYCSHCQQNTIRQVGQSIDCTNPNCDGYEITLSPEKFMALTAADFAEYKAGKYDQNEMNITQAEFETRMAQIEKDQKTRETLRNARVVKEKTFG